jgi:hypothetical protein
MSAPDPAERRVHPLTARFPMMSDDEIEELAEDIKTNGLIHPITLGDWDDGEARITDGVVDGRNRLRACKIAGVEPCFERLNGQDPVAFIVSANLARRNLTVGQRAMLYAWAYPEPEQPGRGRKSIRGKSISQSGVSKARTVLREAPGLVSEVIAGDTTLDAAYLKVQNARIKKRPDPAPPLRKTVTVTAPEDDPAPRLFPDYSNIKGPFGKPLPPRPEHPPAAGKPFPEEQRHKHAAAEGIDEAVKDLRQVADDLRTTVANKTPTFDLSSDELIDETAALIIEIYGATYGNAAIAKLIQRLQARLSTEEQC